MKPLKPRKFRLAALAAVGTLAFHAAQATDYTYSATVDFSGANFAGGDPRAYVSGAQPSFPLVSGDTLSGTILFAGNQMVTIAGPGYSYVELRLTDPSWVSPNAMTPVHTVVTLLDVAGIPAAEPFVFDGFSTLNTLNAFAGYPSGLTSTSVSFVGFDYSVELTGPTAWNSTVYTPPFTPDSVEIYGRSGVSLGTYTPPVDTPEPISAVLLGFAVMAVALLRGGFSRGAANRGESAIG